MPTGEIAPQYAYSVMTDYGILNFYYAGNWPSQPWPADTSSRQQVILFDYRHA